MRWEEEYKSNERLWGEQPSELALAAVAFIQTTDANAETLSILDLGCGYGRDALYYAESLDCSVLGIDLAAKGIEMGKKAASDKAVEGVNFECRDLKDFHEGAYDVVCASNLYQLLRPEQRGELRETVEASLKPGGLFLLSTLSTIDPEHFGIGEPIAGEANSYSFDFKTYLHFCTGDELRGDFAFLDIAELYEKKYDEPRATGEVHHHISWILIGKRTQP
jgi:SAM-dependent methyltransferase